ncbi:ABC transporter ATP-binding protein [Rhodococcus triatomae]|uniref:ABC-type quaternary amine transporter n=1 Tax=Rhodococcus triatomae TaxID=300028 RepID=A0A1G8PJP1_9NOCA|nr:ABC transporter ATP-binding protein [Rhodococcus triatomae]QNG20120.1 ABC transporter ATP-binding protein [Rhodococcus triatomae]QNG23964.1 ABC transporter ATP-binding protein [Rhodococcus triatomae]SDI92518.1 iron(III) transport system ATP-binding protein [Rhodococcus triatomae]
MSEVLSLEAVSASYGGDPVLHDVSVRVPPGEMLAVLGPSGGGKTTLLRSIAGLHRIDAGTIRLGDRALAASAPHVHVAPERRGIGLMPQDNALFPHLSVGNNIGFGLSGPWSVLRGSERAARRRRIADLLELVGLDGLGDARPQELSGGQQQRVALARALAPGPGVMLMDEPFASLDAGLRAGVGADVARLLRDQGVGSVLVTHDRKEALGTADRVAVILDGGIRQEGTPEELYHRPTSVAVGRFIGEGSLLDAHRSGERAQTAVGVVPVTGNGDGAGSVLIRPEQIRLTVAATGDFEVVRSSFGGPSTIVTVRRADTELTVQVADGVVFEPGAAVDVDVVGAVVFFPAHLASSSGSG